MNELDVLLDNKRLIADPLADQTVEKLIESNGLDSIRLIFDIVSKNEDLPEVEMPEVLRSYFEETAQLPEWVDFEKIREGERFFEEYGLQISMMLLCKSLPATYACAKGAEVLHMTGRFQADENGDLSKFTRRLMETAQFVIDVMSEGGLGPNGRGIRTAQKVRLIHAAIRYYLLNKHNWDTEYFGLPINQEDMAGTLLAFSVFPLEGLLQIGVDLTEEEKESYLYAWRVVGHIMGVLPELIPQNYDEGIKLGYQILDDQKAPSEAGRELTDACVTFMQNIIPGTVLDFYPKLLMRHLIGDELADIVGIEAKDSLLGSLIEKASFIMIDAIDDTMDHSEIISKLAQHFNKSLLQGMLLYFNDYKKVHFYIPPSLKENWEKTTELGQPEWLSVISTPAIGKWRLSIQHHTQKS
ncbi:oxygenase MpaB family protein [Sediminitomix flava]|uniref:Uncharacterized protein DUF2236 n=1 Tax=Sediminitomix flava TaxID=379075 RepID=A0A316A0H6_SEDFL|nr:oxygenase MpaB family protein [Sediminitomix flava]PWJ43147.1 uncharacterized protein DUF2236 [Sediminitomix flava]